MSIRGRIRTRIQEIVSQAKHRRVRPSALERMVMQDTGASRAEVRQALNDLMLESRLVYTYRDPCSFVEIPSLEGLRSS